MEDEQLKNWARFRLNNRNKNIRVPVEAKRIKFKTNVGGAIFKKWIIIGASFVQLKH